MSEEASPSTLADLVRRHGQERGGKAAFVCGERRTSFAEFDSKITA